MRILGIDFETTGLSPTEDRITEVGAVLYDWETHTPLQMLSRMVNPERPIPEEITKLTGINDAMVAEFGMDERSALLDIQSLAESADYVMAHNGTTFDKLFFDAMAARQRLVITKKTWLDTKTDIRYPDHISTRVLKHLACEHGILNPFSHRAVFDVLTMLHVASRYPVESIISRAAEPTLFVQALVSFEEKDKAKTRGYLWSAPRKIWWRSFKESDFAAEIEVCGFKTKVLDASPE
jgi:DNA polymerase III subunit epsilon